MKNSPSCETKCLEQLEQRLLEILDCVECVNIISEFNPGGWSINTVRWQQYARTQSKGIIKQ
jgi:hypothetical protein